MLSDQVRSLGSPVMFSRIGPGHSQAGSGGYSTVPVISQARSFYVKCPLHGTSMRSCSRQMSKGSDDDILRSLMFWVLTGMVCGLMLFFELQTFCRLTTLTHTHKAINRFGQVRLARALSLHFHLIPPGFDLAMQPGESAEQLRWRHVHHAAPKLHHIGDCHNF